MAAFRDFVEQQAFVDFVINEFDGTPIQTKPWSAKKPQIMQMWSNLRSDTPIYMTPISKAPGQDGQTYGEDGIRITGSWPFIASVLGRIKDLLAYENPQTKLRLIFRGIDRAHGADPSRVTYVFYVNLDKRGHGRPGRPKKPGVPNPQKGIV